MKPMPRRNERQLIMGEAVTEEPPIERDNESSCSDEAPCGFTSAHGDALEDAFDTCLRHVSSYLKSPIVKSLLSLALWVVTFMIGLSLLLHEDDSMDWIDMMYLMCQIITTVGYGDLPPPRSTACLVFYTLYITSAVMLVAQIVGSFVAKAVEPDKNGEKDKKKKEKDKEGFVSGSFGAFLKDFGVWLGFVITFAIFFMYWPGEEKLLVEAFYMAVVTLTTVGFGDFVPNTQGGKLFASGWMLFGSIAFTMMIGKFGVWTYFLFNKMSVEKLDNKALARIHDCERFQGVAAARAASIDNLLQACSVAKSKDVSKAYSEKISRNDFLVFMLVDMGLVDVDMIDTLSSHFDTLDATGEGFIDRDDLQQAMKEDLEKQLQEEIGQLRPLSGKIVT